VNVELSDRGIWDCYQLVKVQVKVHGGTTRKIFRGEHEDVEQNGGIDKQTIIWGEEKTKPRKPS
jgi:hypothetical protein